MTREVKPIIHLEQLEPRILLSGDSLLNIAPDSQQDTILDNTLQVVQYAELLDTNEQVEEQISLEFVSSETYAYKPIFTLLADDDNTNDESSDADLSIENIDPHQVNDEIAVFSNNSDVYIESKVGTTKDSNMPTYINDADLSIEYATSIAIRGPPLNECVTLQGMYLADPTVDYFDGQVVYLDFDGETGVTYNGPVIVGGIDIPEFSTESAGLAGQEQLIISEIITILEQRFDDAGVKFTMYRPDPGSSYSTIYIGGDDSAFQGYGRFWGLAENVDFGNQDSGDKAFVFSESIISNHNNFTSLTAYLASVIAHETGHLLGYTHENEDSSNVLSSVALAENGHISEDPTWDDISEIVLFGNSSVTIDKNVTINDGFIASNGNIIIDKDSQTEGIWADGKLSVGQSSEVYDDIVVNGKVTIGQDVVVDGDIDGGSIVIGKNAFVDGHAVAKEDITLRYGSTVTGDVIPFDFPEIFSTIILPPASEFQTDPDNDIIARKGRTTTLEPGQYGSLLLGACNTLYLSSGDYFFDRISTGSGLNLNLNLTSGEIAIYVKGDVTFGADLDVFVNNVKMTDAEPELAANVFIETHGKWRMHKNGQWFGTIFAPNGTIVLYKNTTLIGAAYSGYSPKSKKCNSSWNKCNPCSRTSCCGYSIRIKKCSTINFVPTNHWKMDKTAPVANNDAINTPEDTAVLIDVAANDTDVDGDLDPSSAVIVSGPGPGNGTVTNNGDGTFTYDPDPNYYGTDGFTYEIFDTNGASDTAVVNITVTSVNDAPVANDDTATTLEDIAVLVDASVNDTDVDGNLDPSSAVIVSGPGPGNGTVTNNGDGTFTYDPDPNYNGTDGFTYEIFDTNGASDTAVVNITVMPVNDAPVANDDTAVTDEDTPVNVDVLVNDTDVENDPLSITILSSTDCTAIVNDGGTSADPSDDTVDVTPDAGFYGTAQFTYKVNDGALDSNIATVTITVNQVIVEADLAVSVSESLDPVVAGSGQGNLTYVIAVANNGPSDATGVDVSKILTLPSGVTIDSIVPSIGSYAGNIWTVGDLTVGTSETLTIVMTVGPSTTDGAIVSNTATITAVNETLINTGDDTTTENTTVQRWVDLQVSKIDTPDPVTAGSGVGNLTHTVTVTNAGPSDASGVTLNEVVSLPAGTSIVSITPSDTTTYAQANTSPGTWTIGNLAANTSETLTIVMTVGSSTTDGAIVSNTATVTGANETLINTGDDSTTENTSVTCEADLSIIKDNGQTTTIPGDTVTYTIVVTNNGLSDVTGASITDTFPTILTGVTYTSVTTGTVSGNTLAGVGDINDTVNMTAGSTITYIVTGTVDSSATGSLVNTASVSGAIDPNAANDSATDTDTLTSQVDLAVTVTESIDPVIAGSGKGNLVYVVTISNHGPSDALGVTINEDLTLPAGVTRDSVVPSAGFYVDTIAPDGTWTLDLAAGASETLTVTLTVDASTAAATDVISNTATVTGTSGGEIIINTSDDTATESSSVAREVDLAVTNMESVDPVVAGSGTGNLVYVVTVTNNGPSDATGITILEDLTLPAGVSVDSVVPFSGVYTMTSAPDGNWTLDLAAGFSATLILTLTVGDSTSAGTDVISNTATITGTSGGETIINTSDDTATESTSVVRVPVVTVDTLLTNDSTPELTGNVDDTNATLVVTVNGNSYNAINNGDSTWTLPDDTISPSLADGVYNVSISATALAGIIGTDSTVDELTIDATPPAIQFDLAVGSDSEPIGDGRTVFDIVILEGSTEPDTPVSLFHSNDLTSPIAATTSDSSGGFALSNITLVLGGNPFTVAATDLVGNKGTSERTILRDVAYLIEGTNFEVMYEQTFVVPTAPSFLTFTYDTLFFDMNDDFINDAFEAALLDNDDNSLVHKIAGRRDAFFNITEELSTAFGANTVVNGQTVKVDLSHIPSGTDANLVIRLVNNDADTTTSVYITHISVGSGSLGTPVGTVFSARAAMAADAIDFTLLSDVTASAKAEYGRTSFNEDSDVLYAGLQLKNIGTYVIDTPLIVVIEHLSDPSVHVVDADGLTPNGQPYFDFSAQVTGNTLDLSELTNSRDMAFYNPNGVQFTYDLIVLGILNHAPEFVSDPDIEALASRTYSYDAEAVDLDGDTLVYSLLSSPQAMTIDPSTGLINWQPSTVETGNHDVLVHVEDGRGGSDDQAYTLSVLDNVPNRPPMFTSTPVVDANVNTVYNYDADAMDPDGDLLTFTLVKGPVGMNIDPASGLAQWIPFEQQVGQHDVDIQVADGQGGMAVQSYVVDVQPDPANNPPIIISTPVTSGTPGQDYTYDVEAIDPDNDLLTYSLTLAPALMTIDQTAGLILWSASDVHIGSHNVTVQVSDGRGGLDEQSFTLVVQLGALTDLTILNVDRSGLTYDGQALTTTGTVTAKITNLGPADVNDPFKVMFFEDHDHDGLYTKNVDPVFGTVAITNTIPAGQSIIISTQLSGSVLFIGNLVWGFVDSGNVIWETDETNNLAHSGENCMFTPPIEAFDIALEWNWPISGDPLPSTTDSLSTPIVVDLDGDGMPEIVFVTHPNMNFSSAGTLHAIRGDGSGIYFSVDLTSNPQLALHGEAPLVIGDLDLDGNLEIVGLAESGTNLICFNADGSLRWISQPVEGGPDPSNSGLFAGGGPTAIAQIDMTTPTYEILYGRQIVDAFGNVTLLGSGNITEGFGDTGYDGRFSILGDLNLDGIPEIIGGNTAYAADGTVLWQATDSPGGSLLPDGKNAFANFDSDPFPEIVLVADGNVYLLDQDGTLIWGPLTIPYSGPNGAPYPWPPTGGPPTIADFDGDGEPEIGVAGRGNYIVIEPTGIIRWTHSTSDGSGMTGSTAFDFNGDGAVEIVYSDEVYLYVFDGYGDGQGGTYVRGQISLSSLTGTEMPIVADVDADGQAEIITSANLWIRGGQESGIYVFGSPTDSWMPARSIWNQHAYNITNVNDDGTIPTDWVTDWQLNNTYRCNTWTTSTGNPSPAANLTASYAHVGPSPGPSLDFIEDFEDGDYVSSPAWILSNPAYGEAGVVADPTRSDNLVLRVHGTEAAHYTLETDLSGPLEGFDFSAEFLTSANDYHPVFMLLSDEWGVGFWLQQDPAAPYWPETRFRLTEYVESEEFTHSIVAAEMPINTWLHFHMWHDLSSGLIKAEIRLVSDNTLLAEHSFLPTADLKYQSTVKAMMIGAEETAWQYIDKISLSSVLSYSTLTARVGNGGAISASAGVSVAFYDGDPQSGGIYLGSTQTTTSLEPGYFEDVQTTLLVGQGTDIWVWADDDGTGIGQVNECNEDDNIYHPGIVLGQPTDLTITNVVRSGLTYDGQALTTAGTITAEVANLGSSNVNDPFEILFFEDYDHNGLYNMATDNILGSTVVTDPLPSGQSITVSADVSGSVLFLGNIVWGFVDSGDVIMETDELNNLAHSGENCMFTPPIEAFDIALEWKWPIPGEPLPSTTNSVTTPLVVDLDGDEMPEIVFTTYQTWLNPGVGGVLRAIHGNGSGLFFSVDIGSNPELALRADAPLAVGDLDLDGNLEIIGLAESGINLICFNADGSLKWISQPVEGGPSSDGSVEFFGGGPTAIAQIDISTPTREILYGRQIVDAFGNVTLLGTGDVTEGFGHTGWYWAGRFSILADLDLDGVPEIIGGNTAYAADGTVLWKATTGPTGSQLPDGKNAIANFDSDPFPEIVLVADGNVYLLDQDGALIWGPKAIPYSGPNGAPYPCPPTGGPPTIADFDGDGEPEIGVAGRGNYVVFEPNGTIRWTHPTSDGSGITGSTAFDFNGDGKVEIVYSDEVYLYVLDGFGDGQGGTFVRGQVPLGSGTVTEMPIVADVDADEHAEIITSANLFVRGGQESGIYVFGSPTDSWMPARSIWNQHAYNITNVNDNGTIPTNWVTDWQLNNTYRCNTWTTYQGNPYPAANLTSSYVRQEVADEPSLDFFEGFEDGNYTSNPEWRLGNPGYGELGIAADPIRPDNLVVRVHGTDAAHYTLYTTDVTLPFSGFDLSAEYFTGATLAHPFLSLGNAQVGPTSSVGFAFYIVQEMTEPLLGLREVTPDDSYMHEIVTSEIPTNEWLRLRLWHDLTDNLIKGEVRLVSNDTLLAQHSFLPITDLCDQSPIGSIAIGAEETAWQYFDNISLTSAGSCRTLTARVGNGGAVTAPAGISVAFYDGDPQNGGVYLGSTETTVGLEPGYFEDVEITLPLADVSDIWVWADDDGTGLGQVNECNEVDNIYHPGIILGQPTDLTITNVDRSGLTYDGQALTATGTVTAEVTNLGSTDVNDPFEVLFFEDLDHNNLYDLAIDNVLGSTMVVNPLSAGQSTTVSANVSGLVLFVGNIVWGFVDSGDTIVETDETNNLVHSGENCQFDDQVAGPIAAANLTASYVRYEVVDEPSLDFFEGFEDGDLTQNPTWTLTPRHLPNPEPGADEIASDPIRPDNLVLKIHGSDAAHRIYATPVDLPLSGFDLSAEYFTGATLAHPFLSLGNAQVGSTPVGFAFYIYILQEMTEPLFRLWEVTPDDSYMHEIVTSEIPTNEWLRLRLWHDLTDNLIKGEVRLVSNDTLLAQHSFLPITDLCDQSPIGSIAIGAEETAWQYFDNISLTSAGSCRTLTARVGNGGAVTAPAGISVAFYDGDPQNGGVYLGSTETTVGLEPGYFEDVEITLPLADVSDIWVWADDDGTGLGQVNECNEVDNIYHPGIILGQPTDLTITNVDRSGLTYDGQALTATGTVTAEVTNLGPVDVNDPFEVLFFEDRDHNGLYDEVADNVLGSMTVTESLLAGESITVSSDVSGSVLFLGNIVWGFVDSGDAILETNELNNLAHSGENCQFDDPVAGTIAAANLTASYVRYEINSGDVTFTARVGNGGAVSAPASVSVAFYNDDPRGDPGPATFIGPTPYLSRADSPFDLTAPGSYLEDFEDGLLNTPGVTATLGVIGLPSPLTDSVDEDDGAIDGYGTGGHTWWAGPGGGFYVMTFEFEDTVLGAFPTHAGLVWTDDRASVSFEAWDSAGLYLGSVGPFSLGDSRDTGETAEDRFFGVSYAGGLSRIAMTHSGNGMEVDHLQYVVPVAPEFVGSIPTTITLEPGYFEDVEITLPVADASDIWVWADDDGTGIGQVNECNEEDNIYHPGLVIIVSENQSPSIISVPITIGTVGDLYRYDVVASDPDGDPLTFDLPVRPDGMAVDTNRGIVVWTPKIGQEGVHDVLLRVQDGKGGVDLQSFQVTVGSENTPPVITSRPWGPAAVGVLYQYQVTAQDAEGDPLTFDLNTSPVGMTIDLLTGLVTWTPTVGQVGSHSIVIGVDDGQGNLAMQLFDLPVVSVSVNDPPAISSTPRGSIALGQTYLYQIVATDPNNDPLTYSLVTAPAGMTVDNVGLVQWVPTSAQFGINPVEVRVEDGRGGWATQTFAVDVVTQASNNIPQIISTPVFVAIVGQEYAYDAKGTDADCDPLFWSLDSAPIGMSINGSEGTVCWTPSATQIGGQQVIIRVLDGQGGWATQSYTLTVHAVNIPPGITSIPPTQAFVGYDYSYTVQATDPNGDVLQYSLNTAPSGMTIDTGTGLIQWTPDIAQIGNWAVEVRVEDGRDGYAEQQYNLVVLNQTPNQPPIIISTPSLVANIGDLYQYDVNATDPEGDVILFSLTTAPAGMTIDPNTGLLQWTPTISQLGLHNISIVATDTSSGQAQQAFSIAVSSNNQAPIIQSFPTAGAVVGLLWSYDVVANDPDGDPLTYSLGQAPAGMSIDQYGRTRWIPAPGDAGTHLVEIVVSDSLGAADIQTFNLPVIVDTQPPNIFLVASSNPVELNTYVTLTAWASDNVGVQSLLVTMAGTPVVLDGNGQATLLMDTVGNFDIDMTATDTSGNTTNGILTLVVIDTSDVTAPVVSITLPASGATISEFTDIIGTVDDTNLISYSLEVAPASGGAFTEIANGTSTVIDGILGVFDPSILANDTYILRLSATDAGGNWSSYQIEVSVTGDLKLGNFRLSFTDLAIPVSGIPITVTRTYDSLHADYQNDLGYGWRLEISDTNLTTSLPKTGMENIGIFSTFEYGTRVYVTTPGGKREGFTFEPTGPRGFAEAFLGIWHPAFTPDPGVTSRLIVEDFQLMYNSQYNEFQFYGGWGYNPADTAYTNGLYTLATQEGLKYQIDALTGELNTLRDTNSNTLTFTDSSIVSSAGVSVTFERDAKGRITAVVDPSGNRITYAYDAAGDLVSVTDREGNVTQFVYRTNPSHYLDEIIDPLGRTGVRSDYDTLGRLISMTDASGNIVGIAHDPSNFTETVTDALGNNTIYVYDSRGNVITEVDALGNVTQRTYDPYYNYMLTETDALGNTTTYTYDNHGNILTQTDPLGNTTYYTYGSYNRLLTITDPLGNTTTNTYDTKGNLLSTTDALGNTTTYTYDSAGNMTTVTDALGNVTTYLYDSSGNLISQTDALGNATTYTYDANGNQTSMTDALGNVTTYQYNASGNLISQTDALGNTTITEYNAIGQVSATTDALGNRTQYIYDERGLLIQTIYPDGTSTSTEYDAAGQVTAQINELGHRTQFTYDALGRQIETIYPDGAKTTTVYDAAGRMIASIDALGNRTEFEYDAAGRQTIVRDALGNETTSTYDSAGRLIATNDALGNTTQYVYDALSRVVQTILADGSVKSTTYDVLGRVIAETDQAGRTTQFEYDALGRLTAVVDALGQRTQYTYDAVGNHFTQTDANGNTTTFEYDALGRRTATILPLGQRSQTTYNAVGLVIATTDFNGDTINYSYDVRNRLTAKNYPDGTSLTYTYTLVGQRETVTDSRGTTSYTYDDRGRLLSRTDPDGTIISYTYDAAGNRLSVTIPSGTTNYTYDALNRMATVTDPDSGVTTYTYNALGRLIQTVLPNGTIDTRTYDSLHRLLTIEHSNSSGIFESFTYTYDIVGNRISVTEFNGRKVDYTYDALNRLISESITDVAHGNRTISYTYDAVGNRLTRVDSIEGTTTYTYDTNDRLLTETLGTQVTTYTYDANGNTLTKDDGTTVVTYQWNYENRLVGVDTDGDSVLDVIYEYDADGIRVSKTESGQETRFLIDANRRYAQVLEEYVPGAAATVSYIYGTDLISQKQATSTSYYHVDGLGSTRALTDGAGNVTDTYIYDAYGRTIAQTGSTVNLYLFAGEQRDNSIGLDYLRARYMNPNIGCFYGMDPFEGLLNLPMTLHGFLYARANPVRFIDPSGNVSLVEVMSTVAIVSILVLQPQSTWINVANETLVLERIGGEINFVNPDNGQTYVGQRGKIVIGGREWPTVERRGGYVFVPPGNHQARMDIRLKDDGTLHKNWRVIRILYTYSTSSVPRILIHVAYHPWELAGCIAPGMSATPLGVSESSKALDEIFDALGGWSLGRRVLIHVKN